MITLTLTHTLPTKPELVAAAKQRVRGQDTHIDEAKQSIQNRLNGRQWKRLDLSEQRAIVKTAAKIYRGEKNGERVTFHPDGLRALFSITPKNKIDIPTALFTTHTIIRRLWLEGANGPNPQITRAANQNLARRDEAQGTPEIQALMQRQHRLIHQRSALDESIAAKEAQSERLQRIGIEPRERHAGLIRNIRELRQEKARLENQNTRPLEREKDALEAKSALLSHFDRRVTLLREVQHQQRELRLSNETLDQLAEMQIQVNESVFANESMQASIEGKSGVRNIAPLYQKRADDPESIEGAWDRNSSRYDADYAENYNGIKDLSDLIKKCAIENRYIFTNDDQSFRLNSLFFFQNIVLTLIQKASLVSANAIGDCHRQRDDAARLRFNDCDDLFAEDSKPILVNGQVMYRYPGPFAMAPNKEVTMGIEPVSIKRLLERLSPRELISLSTTIRGENYEGELSDRVSDTLYLISVMAAHLHHRYHGTLSEALRR